MDTKYLEGIFEEDLYYSDYNSQTIRKSWSKLALKHYKERVKRADKEIEELQNKLEKAEQEIIDADITIRYLNGKLNKSIWTRFKNTRRVIAFRTKCWIKRQVENW